jgi:hypothetical protein
MRCEYFVLIIEIDAQQLFISHTGAPAYKNAMRVATRMIIDPVKHQLDDAQKLV